MKIASTVTRYLLGLLFTVFGSNGFLHFITPPPPSTAFAMQFMSAAAQSHFLVVIFLFQLVAGLLLLAGRFVPFALVVLAAVLTNILDYHLTMDPAGLAPGIVATVLWFVTALGYRESFRGLFAMGSEPAPASVRGTMSASRS
jgi:hypothetical protein